VRYRDADKRAKAISLIEGVRCVGGTHERGLAVEQVGDMLTITPLGLAKKEGDIRYFFDNTPARAPRATRSTSCSPSTPPPRRRGTTTRRGS
jgi:hypothetical protein